MRKLSSKKKVKKSKGKDEEVASKPDSNENTDENLEANENGGKNDESSGDESDDNKTLKRKSKKDAAEKKSNEDDDEDKESEKNDTAEDEEEEEYEVQDIIDHKVEKGESFYLIRWKGWGSDGDTWEAENTLSCPDIIEKFKKKKGKQPASPAAKGSTRGRKRKSDSGEKAKPADPNKEWEVERVIDVAYEKGVRLFRIRWKGYRPNSDTWEPEEHLNCEDLIAKFLKKNEDAGKREQKDLREQPKKTQRFANDSFRRASKRNSGRSRAVYYDDD